MSEHELWNELGNLYFTSGSYDQAIQAYMRAIALDTDFGIPYSNMAMAYVRKGNYPEAIAFYRRGIELLTDHREKAISWYKLGNVYRRIREYGLAVDAYRTADELSSTVNPSEEDDPEEILFRQTTEEVVLPGTEEEAPSAQAVDGNPSPAFSPTMELPPPSEELSPWWFDEREFPEEDFPPDFGLCLSEGMDASDVSESMVFTEPLNWEFSATRQEVPVDCDQAESKMILEAADSDGALVTTQVVIPIFSEPLQPSASERDKLDYALDQPEEVEIELLEMEKNQTAIPEADLEPETVTEVQEFVAQDVTTPDTTADILIGSGSTVKESSDVWTEINRVKRVLEINPRNDFAWGTLGGLYKSIGQYPQAIDAYQEAVALEPAKIYYMYQLGLVLAAEGKSTDALAAFQKVIEIDPNHGLAHAALGGYYRREGREDLARVHIERARGLLDEEENEYNRACMEAICGNTDRALDLLEIALKNRQTYANWARRDPDLDFIRNDSRFSALLAEYEMRPVQ